MEAQLTVAKQVLERAEELHGADDPKLTAPLKQLGSIYNALGDYKSATEMMTRCLMLASIAEPPDGLTQVECLTVMGTLAIKQFEFEGAQVVAMKAIATAKALEDSENMDLMTVQCYNNLGHAAVGLGAPEIGYNNHIDALSLARKMGRPLLAAESTRGLGLALLALQQHDDALSVMLDAYQLYKQLHPDNGVSPIMVRAEIEYAEALRNAKKYNKALKHAREADSLREYLNPNDPVEVKIYSVLASTIFATQGDIAECIALVDAGMALSDKNAAADGISQTIIEVHTLTKLNNMALKASFLGKSTGSEAAVACQEEVVAGFKVLVGEEDARTRTMEQVLQMLRSPESATSTTDSAEVEPTRTPADKGAASDEVAGTDAAPAAAPGAAAAKPTPNTDTTGDGGGGGGGDDGDGATKKKKGKKRGRRAGKKNKLKKKQTEVEVATVEGTKGAGEAGVAAAAAAAATGAVTAGAGALTAKPSKSKKKTMPKKKKDANIPAADTAAAPPASASSDGNVGADAAVEDLSPAGSAPPPSPSSQEALDQSATKKEGGKKTKKKKKKGKQQQQQGGADGTPPLRPTKAAAKGARSTEARVDVLSKDSTGLEKELAALAQRVNAAAAKAHGLERAAAATLAAAGKAEVLADSAADVATTAKAEQMHTPQVEVSKGERRGKKGRKGKKEKKEISPEPEPTPKMEKSKVKRSAPRELANVAAVSAAKEEAISVGNTNAGLHEAFVTAMSSVVGGGGARPYEQVGEGEYVLDSGKTRLKVRTINGVVLARVGRGWEPLETFLATRITPSSATPASASPETPAANNAQ
eukprot:gene10025-25197_t